MFLADIHETAVGACFADADKTADRAYIADTPEMTESANHTDSDEMAEGLYLADTPYLADKGFYTVGTFWAVAAYAEMLFGADNCILAVGAGITAIVWIDLVNSVINRIQPSVPISRFWLYQFSVFLTWLIMFMHVLLFLIMFMLISFKTLNWY